MRNSITTFRIVLACMLHLPRSTVAASETVIFIVHGTYDGTGAWVNVVADKTSFASEVQRGYGGYCEIVPFLWRTSVKHEIRVTAAQRLARQLDDDKYANAKNIVIAHSHGGNVALEAIGRCRRSLDTVVCLSTPHVFLNTKNADAKRLRLSVYCRPEARKRINRLITVTPITDPVLRVCDGLRLGLNEQTAIEWTTDWRRLTNNPRLAGDGGPLTEIVEDILDTKLTSRTSTSPMPTSTWRPMWLACALTTAASAISSASRSETMRSKRSRLASPASPETPTTVSR